MIRTYFIESLMPVVLLCLILTTVMVTSVLTLAAIFALLPL